MVDAVHCQEKRTASGHRSLINVEYVRRSDSVADRDWTELLINWMIVMIDEMVRRFFFSGSSCGSRNLYNFGFVARIEHSAHDENSNVKLSPASFPFQFFRSNFSQMMNPYAILGVMYADTIFVMVDGELVPNVNLYATPYNFYALLAMCSMWFLNVKCSSKIMPRSRVVGTRLMRVEPM